MAFYKVKINFEALQDIDAANLWYDKQKINLGNRFQKQVAAQIETLKKNPKSYSFRYENVRCMRIKKFPFLVHFTIDEANNIVNIYAIFHTSRNPKIWLKRIL